MSEKKITLKDIAKLVNLSPSTVSLAINNKPGLSKDTRECILRVAQAMNFTPNITARSLVTQRSNRISLLNTGPGNTATCAERLEGALKALKDYRLIHPNELIGAGSFLKKVAMTRPACFSK